VPKIPNPQPHLFRRCTKISPQFIHRLHCRLQSRAINTKTPNSSDIRCTPSTF